MGKNSKGGLQSGDWAKFQSQKLITNTKNEKLRTNRESVPALTLGVAATTDDRKTTDVRLPDESSSSLDVQHALRIWSSVALLQNSDRSFKVCVILVFSLRKTVFLNKCVPYKAILCHMPN